MTSSLTLQDLLSKINYLKLLTNLKNFCFNKIYEKHLLKMMKRTHVSTQKIY